MTEAPAVQCTTSSFSWRRYVLHLPAKISSLFLPSLPRSSWRCHHGDYAWILHISRRDVWNHNDRRLSISLWPRPLIMIIKFILWHLFITSDAFIFICYLAGLADFRLKTHIFHKLFPVFHHSLLAPTWTAFSDYTVPDLLCTTVFHF